MIPETIWITDTETSGLDGPVVEVALVRWSLQFACVVSCWSTLVLHHENLGEQVNRIPPTALGMGVLPSDAIESVSSRVGDGVVLGWNINFDRQRLEEMPGRMSPSLRWVDAANLPWPNAKPYAPMHETALAMGVGIVHAHRALPDCLLIARMLERAVELGLDVRAMLAHAMQPRKLYVGLQHFNDNQAAKDLGFWFDRATKRWLRQATASEVAAFPFPCREAP